jgi:CheY-like chemotaxis protein
MSASDPVPGRSGSELLHDQLQGLTAWQRALAQRMLAAGVLQDTREQRLDARRRIDALKRAHSALLEQADRLVEDTHALLDGGPARGIVVHRDPWMRRRLSESFNQVGLRVVAEADDGAEGLGLAILEQPEVLLLESRLPSMTGLEVVSSARELAPKTLIAVQVDHDGDMTALLDAGADAVYNRRLPAAVLCEQVLERLRDRPTARV